jgi:hypothetical protein
LSDYLDPAIGMPVNLFDTQQILRFAIASEVMFVPSQA